MSRRADAWQVLYQRSRWGKRDDRCPIGGDAVGIAHVPRSYCERHERRDVLARRGSKNYAVGLEKRCPGGACLNWALLIPSVGNLARWTPAKCEAVHICR